MLQSIRQFLARRSGGGGSGPEVILDVLFDDGFLFLAVRNIAFLAPGREIRTFLDTAASYFQRKQPTQMTAKVVFQDGDGRYATRIIRHNLEIYREIDGIPQSGFREVFMPAATVDVIEYREGHEPTVVRKLRGRVHFGNIILRWGVTASRDLYDWWRRVQDGAADRRAMSVILLDDDRAPVKRWNFRNAWPVRYQVSALDAIGREVLMETLEIAHEGMELA